MKTLYIECNMGAAGDMLMSALSELHPDAEGFMTRLSQIGIPDVEFERRQAVKWHCRNPYRSQSKGCIGR